MTEELANKVKHLEMIERIIERMAKNSFQIKGWTMTLVTIVGAFGTKEADKRFFLLAALPILGFWVLDAFYLQLERKYRALYRSVCETEPNNIDFHMNTKNIKYTNDEAKSIRFFNCLKSTSVSVFYGIIAVTLIVLVSVLKGWITY